MYFLIPFLKVDGEHKWVPPRLCESTQLETEFRLYVPSLFFNFLVVYVCGAEPRCKVFYYISIRLPVNLK